MLPTRRNVFDDDEFDRLAVDTSRLNFGRQNASKTADDILQDRTTAPSKAAILSALAAFDADDDERDDTYDVEDVGGTVDTITNPEAESNLADLSDKNEEVLFKAFRSTPSVFDRDAATKRGTAREKLRVETGLTDEAIEGWSIMLSRDPRRIRKLENKYSQFEGGQVRLNSTKWTAAGSGAEESDFDASRDGFRGRGRGVGRGRGRGGGGGRGGNVAGPTGEKETEEARRRKEANKGRGANHNRKSQRGKKMARGGFPG